MPRSAKGVSRSPGRIKVQYEIAGHPKGVSSFDSIKYPRNYHKTLL